MLNIRFDGKLDYVIDNISYVNVMRNKKFSVSFRNGKPKYTLISVSSGKLFFKFLESKEELLLSCGAVLFIPKECPYIVTYEQNNTEGVVLSFDMYSNNIPPLFSKPFSKKSSAVTEIFSNLSVNHSGSVTLLASKIYEILHILEKIIPEVPEKFSKIAPALYEIQKNYFRNLKISYYSDLCDMSESNFRKLFKEYTGKSFIEYRNLIRISKAKRMIESREYTVAEAAYLTGFNNMSFFYEIYNRHLS